MCLPLRFTTLNPGFPVAELSVLIMEVSVTTFNCMRKSNVHAMFSFVYQDVKCSGNWMWPAKLPGEGATLYDACAAMCDVMASLGIAIDGGKDSLSMAARVGQDTVKSPGSLVISVYAACPDIRATVTPDLKMPDGKGNLLWVQFGDGSKHRLGGSALAQVYNQLGSQTPDLDDAKVRLATKKYILLNLLQGRRLWYML